MNKFHASTKVALLCGVALAMMACGANGAQSPLAAPPSPPLVAVQTPASEILFLSTQLNPVEEAGKMRKSILKDFPGKVLFEPNDNSFIYRQIKSILAERPDTAILIGALHGDLVKLHDDGSLQALDDVYARLAGRGFMGSLVNLCRLDGEHVYYIPWMQASYVMVASKKALEYLPPGVAVNSLTYGQLSAWAANIAARTGRKLLGLPAGEKGLMHRFLQGYLYPSFTGSTLVKFRSPQAVAMWQYFKELWEYVYPGSLNYSTMADPLLVGDVWIAWDHTARLMRVFQEKPDDFVAFPAPAGPKGRGFLAVVSGLAIPAQVRVPGDPELLIDYLTQGAIQQRTLLETGFFPVLDMTGPDQGGATAAGLSAAVRRQSTAADSIPVLLPVGLGEGNDAYNEVFMLAFSDIVLGGKDIAGTLQLSAQKLQAILDQANARAWQPDKADTRPVQIE